MKWIAILMILLLAACSAPAGLDAGNTKDTDTTEANAEDTTDNENINETTTDPSEETNDDTKANEDTDEGLPERPEGLALDDRIDITLGSGEGTVEGTVAGKYEKFKKDYDDIDALVFDAAEVFGVTLYEARYMTYVDGSRLLRPSELENVEEEISTLEDPKLDVSNIKYHETFDEGFIRGVGCDRDEGIMIINVTQDHEEDHGLFRNVKPMIKNAIVFRLNKRVLDTLYCTDIKGNEVEVLESGEQYQCRKSNVQFVEDLHGVLDDNIDRGDIQNEIAAGIPGRSEIKYFNCFYDNVNGDLKENATEGNETTS